jgi:fatty-acyl-CoA synthase
MIEELRRTTYDLSSLAVIGTGGAPTSAAAKRGLMELLPHVTIRDGYGASEIGAMTSGEVAGDGQEVQHFPLPGSARLLSADRSRFLDAGDDEVGWMVRTGHVPLGYLDDEDASRSTFPLVDGVRIAIPGDRARFTADGQVVLLGRDSLVVNTGGEKVFVEEVEDVLKRHDDVVDALVIGRPSERFGQEVTAIVQLTADAEPQPTELRAWCATHLARFKAPRAFVFVEQVERYPSGKANYQWARSTGELAVEAR